MSAHSNELVETAPWQANRAIQQAEFDARDTIMDLPPWMKDALADEPSVLVGCSDVQFLETQARALRDVSTPVPARRVGEFAGAVPSPSAAAGAAQGVAARQGRGVGARDAAFPVRGGRGHDTAPHASSRRGPVFGALALLTAGVVGAWWMGRGASQVEPLPTMDAPSAGSPASGAGSPGAPAASPSLALSQGRARASAAPSAAVTVAVQTKGAAFGTVLRAQNSRRKAPAKRMRARTTRKTTKKATVVAASRPPASAASRLATEPGTLSLQIQGGWAHVSIDGTSAGATPLVGRPLSPGRHEVALARPSIDWVDRFTVEVHPGETLRILRPVPAPGPSSPRALTSVDRAQPPAPAP